MSRVLTVMKVRNQAGVSQVTAGGESGGTAEWLSFTPSVTATVNPDFGSGSTAFISESSLLTTSARYIPLGDIVCAQYTIVFGTVMDPGEGTYQISLPPGISPLFHIDSVALTPSGMQNYWPIIGDGHIYDGLNNQFIYVLAFPTSTTTFALRSIERTEGTPSTLVGGNQGPCEFDGGSFMEIQLWYPMDGSAQ